MAADPIFDPAVIQQWARDVGIVGLMYTKWGWPVAEIIHFTGLCLLFGTVGLFDLRMLGVARGVSLQALHGLVPFGVAGFAMNLATGSMFFVTQPGQYLHNPAMQAKLALIAVAGINMAFFYTTAARAVWATGAGELPPLRARVFGAVSLGCWVGVIACGRVITAFRPPFHWCFWC